jgi:myo-inositol 2-dehydrogenase/D-chiro-inositol 1-dehydrogenase
MTLRYGLIGCGMMGQEHIRNIELLDDTQITVVFEPDARMRASAAKALPKAAMVESLEALLAFEALDCLVIVSPNHCHLPQLQQIAALRALPILCEKPLFTDPADLAQATAFAQSYPAPVWVAMEYRFMPPVAALIDQAEDITGGIKMLTIREHRFPFLPKVGDWNRFNDNSGGTLVEKCCHFFDLMRLILGSEPVSVVASAGQNVNHLNETYAGQTPDIWDNGYAVFDFENGARAMLDLCMFAEGSRHSEELAAMGDKAKVECLLPQNIVTHGHRDTWVVDKTDIHVPEEILNAGYHSGATYHQNQAFLAAVRGEAEVIVTAEDGHRAVAMGVAAQMAAREKRRVDMTELGL